MDDSTLFILVAQKDDDYYDFYQGHFRLYIYPALAVIEHMMFSYEGFLNKKFHVLYTNGHCW